jgi:sec-independent protein translocase protein TatB
MFDISWTEFLLIGVVALIAIGPKEMPGVLRTAGQWMGKIRRMAAEFQGQFHEVMREAEMADLKKEVDDIGASASNLASGLNDATRIEDPLKPSTPAESSEAISGAPPPPLATETPAAETHGAETHAEAAAPLPAPAEQPTPPPSEAAPAPTPPPAADFHVPLPEPPPPLTSADFADAPTIHPPTLDRPKSGEGA